MLRNVHCAISPARAARQLPEWVVDFRVVAGYQNNDMDCRPRLNRLRHFVQVGRREIVTIGDPKDGFRIQKEGVFQRGDMIRLAGGQQSAVAERLNELGHDRGLSEQETFRFDEAVAVPRWLYAST